MTSGFRVAARLARREVRRRPGRTTLVALLVAFPVMAMMVAVVYIRTDHLSAEAQFRLDHGFAADFVAADLRPLPVELLPEGSRTVRYSTTYRIVRNAEGERARAAISNLPMTDPLAEGIVRVVSGRAPDAPGEVLLSPPVADEFGVDVGDELVLERPQPAALTVVGIGERRTWLDESLLVLGPGTRWIWNDAEQGVTELVDLPGTPTAARVRDAAQRVVNAGYGVEFSGALEPESSSAEDGNTAVRWSWVIGAVALTVVAIVIAAAFAAGARRQLTTLGQLAANGAEPRVLRRVLFLQGTVTGLIGAVAGLILGAAALAALRPHIDNIADRDIGAWVIKSSDLVPIVILGVVAATLAALVPARTTSRVPVLAALSGRRPLGAVPRWLTSAGVAAVASGLALLGLAVLGSNGGSNSDVWALTAIIGGIGVLLGACAVAPRYVSVLEPAAGRLRASWRLAARSLARQRTRTSAVVSAVCATCALAIAASALVLGGNASGDDGEPYIRDDFVVLQTVRFDATPSEELTFVEDDRAVPAPDPYTFGEGVTTTGPPDRALLGTIRAELPDVSPTQLQVVDARGLASSWSIESFSADAPSNDELEFGKSVEVTQGEDARSTAIGRADDDLARAYRLDDESRRALHTTGAVLLGSLDGRATIALTRADGTPVRFEVAVIGGEHAIGPLPPLLIAPEKMVELGLTAAAGPVAFDVPDMTRDQREMIMDAVEQYTEDQRLAGGLSTPGATAAFTDTAFSWPNDDVPTGVLEAILGGIALLFALFVVGTSLALAAAETRDERDVLDVVGASPAVMRRTSGRKAVLLTVLGVALAIPVGFLPVVVFTGASDESMPLVFPVRTVALLALAVPAVVGAVTMLGSAIALRIRPVRISTMTFE